MTIVVGGYVLSFAPASAAQSEAAAPAPKPRAQAPAPAPMAKPASPAAAPAPKPNSNVVVVEPIRVFDPFLDYPYPYAYPPDYMNQNFGYVKIETHRKDASVYVDGGFADNVQKAKKFALRPGNHEIELRDSDGRSIFHEKVAVLVGKTTTLHAG
jgi:hypothetical protein